MGFVFILLVVASTAAGSTTLLAGDSIPESVVDMTRQYIISRVGDEFFANHYEYLQEHSFLAGSGSLYVVRWKFNVIDSCEVYCLAEFYIELDGNYVDEPTGVPDCLNIPSECEISISDTVAVSNAVEMGLIQANQKYDVYLRWYGGSLAWGIRCETMRVEGYSAGSIYHIDANDGKYLGEMLWRGHDYGLKSEFLEPYPPISKDNRKQPN